MWFRRLTVNIAVHPPDLDEGLTDRELRVGTRHTTRSVRSAFPLYARPWQSDLSVRAGARCVCSGLTEQIEDNVRHGTHVDLGSIVPTRAWGRYDQGRAPSLQIRRSPVRASHKLWPQRDRSGGRIKEQLDRIVGRLAVNVDLTRIGRSDSVVEPPVVGEPGVS